MTNDFKKASVLKEVPTFTTVGATSERTVVSTYLPFKEGVGFDSSILDGRRTISNALTRDGWNWVEVRIERADSPTAAEAAAAERKRVIAEVRKRLEAKISIAETRLKAARTGPSQEWYNQLHARFSALTSVLKDVTELEGGK